MAFRQVIREEFYDAIRPLNVHPHPVGGYPYTVIFKDPSGLEHGRCKDNFTNGHVSTDYFLGQE